MSAELLPVSAVIATRNRPDSLKKTFESLAGQSIHPTEIVVVDSSADDGTEQLRGSKIAGIGLHLKWTKGITIGAASQRNEGVAAATQPFIWFFDDDILFEPNCVERVWKAISSDPKLGGVNAMIVNQKYGTPGAISRLMFRLMNGKAEPTYAGRVIGPAVNLLPEDRDDLPEVIPVEWLNTTCTIYRREALPNPPFPVHFTGYSLMEDLALSLEVGKKWKLANARTARIVHDSQPADYKSDERARSCMELVNRDFIMTNVMNRHGLGDYVKLAIWELFSFMSVMGNRTSRRRIAPTLVGKWDALLQIFSRNNAGS